MDGLTLAGSHHDTSLMNVVPARNNASPTRTGPEQAAAARSNGTETRYGQEPRQQSNPQSPRPEPTERLRGRMVVDAKVLRNRADASAAVVHRSNLQGDRLVDRGLNRPEKLRLKLNRGGRCEAFAHASNTPNPFVRYRLPGSQT